MSHMHALQIEMLCKLNTMIPLFALTARAIETREEGFSDFNGDKKTLKQSSRIFGVGSLFSHVTNADYYSLLFTDL